MTCFRNETLNAWSDVIHNYMNSERLSEWLIIVHNIFFPWDLKPLSFGHELTSSTPGIRTFLSSVIFQPGEKTAIV